MGKPDPRQDELKAIYDGRYAGGYMRDDSFGRWSRSGVELRRVRETLEQIPREGIRRILDYGCGRGAWIPLLERDFPGARIAGIDLSSTAIEKAGVEHPSHQFTLFDGERAPFPDASFDLVFSYHVLEHVLDLEAVAADMARVTAPGGFLCVIFPCGNAGSLEESIVSRVTRGRERTSRGATRFFYEDPTHVRRARSREILELFGRHGATIRAEFYANQFFGALDWISNSGRSFAGEILPVGRGVSVASRARLLGLRLVLIATAGLIDLRSVDPDKPRSGPKRVVLRAAAPLKGIGGLAGRALQRLALWEWERYRRQPNGSAQFLVFQK